MLGERNVGNPVEAPYDEPRSEPVVKTGTQLLLEQQAKVEEARALKIQELLTEKTQVVEFAMKRVETIKEELKALGYKAPRKKSENSAEKPAESLDNSAANG